MEVAFKLFVWHPVEYLFRHGPCTRFFPFWCGKSDQDICAEISKTIPEVWIKSHDYCSEMIEREINSYTTLFSFSIYILLMMKIVRMCFDNGPAYARQLAIMN